MVEIETDPAQTQHKEIKWLQMKSQLQDDKQFRRNKMPTSRS